MGACVEYRHFTFSIFPGEHRVKRVFRPGDCAIRYVPNERRVGVLAGRPCELLRQWDVDDEDIGLAGVDVVRLKTP